MKYFNIILFGLLLCSNYYRTIQAEEMIGTLGAHRAIWKQYEDSGNKVEDVDNKKQTRTKYYETEEARYKEAIIVKETEMSDIRRSLDDGIRVVKDEFEKTSEYEQRVKTLRNNRESEIRLKQGEIRALKKRSDELRNKYMADIKELEQLNNKIITSIEVFLVLVNMGNYNADNERISDFTIKPFKAQDGKLIRVYEIHGEIGGISVSREVAKQLRQYSDDNELWALIRRRPKSITFDNVISVPRSSSQITKEREAIAQQNTIKSWVAGMAVLIGGVLLNNPDVASKAPMVKENLQNESENRSVKAEEYVSACVIRTGWEGTVTPDHLVRANNQSQEATIIWSK